MTTAPPGRTAQMTVQNPKIASAPSEVGRTENDHIGTSMGIVRAGS